MKYTETMVWLGLATGVVGLVLLALLDTRAVWFLAMAAACQVGTFIHAIFYEGEDEL